MPKDLIEKNSEQGQSIAKVKADFKRKEKKGGRERKEEEEFGQKILDLVRVTRVTAGGKKMRFRACLAIGDRKGRIGIGVAKGSDVSEAISKSFAQAQKNLFNFSNLGGRIPHIVQAKYGAAKVFLKPGKAGDGIIAGGIVRNVLDLAGFKDVVAKILGKGNNINTATATIMALNSFVPKGIERLMNEKDKDKKINK